MKIRNAKVIIKELFKEIDIWRENNPGGDPQQFEEYQKTNRSLRITQRIIAITNIIEVSFLIWILYRLT